MNRHDECKVSIIAYGGGDYEAYDFERLGSERIRQEIEETLPKLTNSVSWVGEWSMRLIHEVEVDNFTAAQKFVKAVLAVTSESGVGDSDALKNTNVLVVISQSYAPIFIYGSWEEEDV